MNLLIPTIMLISCLYIVWHMMREKKQPNETIIELTDEQVGNIESKLKRDKDIIHYWRNTGRFNITHYVKYLEYKEANKA